VLPGRLTDMNCPRCLAPDSKVIDSRLRASGAIYRRRKCRKCSIRFTSTETIFAVDLLPPDGKRRPRLARPVQ
jgi:transcriptional repressor NrdR